MKKKAPFNPKNSSASPKYTPAQDLSLSQNFKIRFHKAHFKSQRRKALYLLWGSSLILLTACLSFYWGLLVLCAVFALLGCLGLGSRFFIVQMTQTPPIQASNSISVLDDAPALDPKQRFKHATHAIQIKLEVIKALKSQSKQQGASKPLIHAKKKLPTQDVCPEISLSEVKKLFKKQN